MIEMHSLAPGPTEYAPMYEGYVQRILGKDVLEVLRRQKREFGDFIAGLSDAKAGYRYAPEKWTVKQVIQHVIDAERVFAYRLMSFCRGETTPLPGFDENRYADAEPATHKTAGDLRAEFDAVRQGTLTLIDGLRPEHWKIHGLASGTPVSVRALVHIIAGHCAHHRAVLRERYEV